jgi:hypothetical protein
MKRTRSVRWVGPMISLLVVAASASGCAVVSVASTAVGVAATAGGVAVDAAVGTAKVAGKVVSKTVDVVAGDDE